MGEDMTGVMTGGVATDMDAVNVTPLEPKAPPHLLVPVERLRWALRATLRAASPDETRYVLCGVHVEYHATEQGGAVPCPAGTLRFISTDGHRLHIADVYAPRNDVVAPLAFGVTLELAQLEALAKALPRPAKRGPPLAPVVITRLSALMYRAQIGYGATIDLPVIDGRFPDWRQVVPPPCDLTDPIGHVGGRHATTARAGRWSVNPDYLADACACAPSKGLTLHTPEDDLSPMRLESSDPDVGTLTAVIMPMRT